MKLLILLIALSFAHAVNAQVADDEDGSTVAPAVRNIDFDLARQQQQAPVVPAPVYGPHDTEPQRFERCSGLAGEQLPSCLLEHYGDMFAEPSSGGLCRKGFKIKDLSESTVFSADVIDARPTIQGAPRPLSDFTERRSGRGLLERHSGPGFRLCTRF